MNGELNLFFSSRCSSQESYQEGCQEGRFQEDRQEGWCQEGRQEGRQEGCCPRCRPRPERRPRSSCRPQEGRKEGWCQEGCQEGRSQEEVNVNYRLSFFSALTYLPCAIFDFLNFKNTSLFRSLPLSSIFIMSLNIYLTKFHFAKNSYTTCMSHFSSIDYLRFCQ